MTIRTLAHLLCPQGKRYRVRTGITKPIRQTTILVPRTRADTLIRRPLGVTTVLTTPLNTIRGRRMNTLQAQVKRTHGVLIRMVTRMISITLSSLVRLVGPLMTLQLMNASGHIRQGSIRLIMINLIKRNTRTITRHLIVSSIMTTSRTHRIGHLTKHMRNGHTRINILTRQLHQSVLIAQRSSVKPGLVQSRRTVILAVSIRNTLSLITPPCTTTKVIQQTRRHNVSIILNRLSLRILGIRTPRTPVIRLGQTISGTVTHNFSELNGTSMNKAISRCHVTQLSVYTRHQRSATRRTIFMTSVLQHRTLGTITATLPFSSTIRMLIAQVRVTGRKVLNTLGSIFLGHKRHNGVRVHRPRKSTIRTLIKYIQDRIKGFSPKIGNSNIRAITISGQNGIMFRTRLPYGTSYFNEHCYPPT